MSLREGSACVSFKQVSHLFHPPKSSAKEQSSELGGGGVHVSACAFDYEHEHMQACKRPCILAFVLACN